MKLSCLEGICSELCGQLIRPQVEPEASRDVLSRGPGQGAGSPLEGVHSGCASPLEGAWSGLGVSSRGGLVRAQRLCP